MKQRYHFTRRSGRRVLSIIVAVVLFTTALPFAFAAYDSLYVKTAEKSDITFGGGAKSAVYSGTFGGKSGKLYALEFTPSEKLVPTLVYGNKLYGTSRLTQKLSGYQTLLGESGTVVGGINGSFFHKTAEGTQIQNGILLSTNSYAYEKSNKFTTIGFTADGKAFYGTPKFEITADIGGTAFPISGYNYLPRATDGVWLVSDSYADKTHFQNGTYTVITLQKLAGQYKINDTLSVRFVEKQVGVTAPVTAAADHLYLLGHSNFISALADAAQAAGEFTIHLKETSGENWENAYTALCGGDLLVKEGKVLSPDGFDSAIKNLKTARSAIGIKKDGSVGLFVAGNESKKGGGNGLPLVNLAQTLVNMGYTTAINLDGGGSSTFVTAPYGQNMQILNSPSDGGERAVGNGLALVSFWTAPRLLDSFESEANYSTVSSVNGRVRSEITTDPSKVYAGRAALELSYLRQEDVAGETFGYRFATPFPVSGGSVSIQVLADAAGHTLTMNYLDEKGAEQVLGSEKLDFSGYRTLTFSLPAAAKAVSGFTVTTVSGGSIGGSLCFDQLRFASLAYTDKAAPTIVDTTPKDTLAVAGATLSAKAQDISGVDESSCRLLVDQTEVTPAVQTNSISYTLPQNATKAITQVTFESADTFGNRTRYTRLIPSSFYTPTQYFDDIPATHWASLSANYCKQQGLISGTSTTAKLYDGNANMTRAQFATILVRYKKLDVKQYEKVTLPYEDAATIPAWALPYVRAAYAEGLMVGSKIDGKLYFNGSEPITRAQVCTALASLYPTLYGYTTASAFVDSSSFPTWAAEKIQKCAGLGIIVGNDKGAFCPNDNMTRYALASALARL